jgi:hypothetical protein
LSSAKSDNPVFWDWNVIYMPYCDGTSWAGNVDQPINGLYFKGKAILDAILSDLKKTTAISTAEQVVISGGSAGASAAFWHSDRMAMVLDLQGGGEVVAMPDAGFFLDLKDYKGGDCWPVSGSQI